MLIEHVENREMKHIGIGAFNFFLTAFTFVIDNSQRQSVYYAYYKEQENKILQYCKVRRNLSTRVVYLNKRKVNIQSLLFCKFGTALTFRFITQGHSV